MKYSDELNMAITAVMMDKMLDRKTKEEIITAIAETEILADIGEATEKWFEEGHVMEYSGNEVYNVDDLIEWAEEIE